MPNVEFNEMRSVSGKVPPQPEPKGLAGFLVKKGIVKNEAHVNLILIGTAMVFFSLSVLVFFFG